MKILTGKLKGQAILFRPNPHLRPTSDKARKAVFDMLQDGMEGRKVLDLFSGTGALGLEALSQGASRVVFVEQDAAQCRRIGENLKRLKIERSAEVCQWDVTEWLLSQKAGEVFDFIFLDPPYATGMAVKTLEALAKTNLLSDSGFVVMECRRKERLPEVGGLTAVREKHYGQTKILIFSPRA